MPTTWLFIYSHTLITLVSNKQPLRYPHIGRPCVPLSVAYFKELYECFSTDTRIFFMVSIASIS
jgi:hypothetical protein